MKLLRLSNSTPFTAALLGAAFIGATILDTGCARKYSFRTDPSEAQVYLNDNYVGKTPLEIGVTELPPTPNLRLRVEKEGFSSVNTIIPGPSLATFRSDIAIGLKQGEDETSKLNRAMGYLLNAQKLIVSRRLPEAAQLIDKALVENPRYVYAQMLRASVSFLSKDFSSAIAGFQRVIELDPTNAEAIRMLNYLKGAPVNSTASLLPSAAPLLPGAGGTFPVTAPAGGVR